VVALECQEKNRRFVLFFSCATSSFRWRLQLVWDAMKQMIAEIEDETAE
jgi:hypothetical protein